MPKLYHLGHRVILDLEDSVQDSVNPANTPARKAAARDGLREIASKHADVLRAFALSIRINAQNTDGYQLDIELLEEIAGELKWDAIWLPMVEGPDGVRQLREDLSRWCVDEIGVVPIIETVRGVEDLESLLSAAEELNLTRIHYGHYDYSLDAEHWPFWHQDEDRFWEHVEKLIAMIEDYGLTYVHTPLGELENDDLFLSIDTWLSRVCREPHARTTLNLRQSQLVGEPSTMWDLDRQPACSKQQLSDLARRTIRAFEDNQASERSFSLDDGQFITPHEYRAAARYLERFA